MAGQSTWEPQGYGNKDYIVPFETEKNIAKEFRYRSAFGKLSKPMKKVTVGQGQEEMSLDVGQSACIWSKEETNTDQCRFTLEQNIKGAPSYGEAPVRAGDYLPYLHAVVYLNQIDTPAIPVVGEMSKLRVKTVISSPESRVRSELSMYLAEQFTYDALDGHFLGASRNLMATKGDGGLALDLGLGAGVQVSPENFLVAGNGFVAGTTGTAGYETALETALGTLTDTAADYFSRNFVHKMRGAVTDRKIAPVKMDGQEEKWYVACDPDLLRRLSSPDSVLYNDWQQGRERAKSNPVFGHGAIELDGFIFFPEQRLKQYRPDISSGIVWGDNADDRRETDVSSRTIALMVVMGEGCLLNAHNGTTKITVEEARHGKGAEFAGHIKHGFMRTRYIPKDGRTGVVINQSSMTVAFYEPGTDWTTA